MAQFGGRGDRGGRGGFGGRGGDRGGFGGRGGGRGGSRGKTVPPIQQSMWLCTLEHCDEPILTKPQADLVIEVIEVDEALVAELHEEETEEEEEEAIAAEAVGEEENLG